MLNVKSDSLLPEWKEVRARIVQIKAMTPRIDLHLGLDSIFDNWKDDDVAVGSCHAGTISLRKDGFRIIVYHIHPIDHESQDRHSTHVCRLVEGFMVVTNMQEQVSLKNGECMRVCVRTCAGGALTCPTQI